MGHTKEINAKIQEIFILSFPRTVLIIETKEFQDFKFDPLGTSTQLFIDNEFI